jgi:hypothetical protein
MERVKRRDDKQWKGSNERRTNNRKGQKKRQQTIERVKRKESKEKRTNNRKGQEKSGQTIVRVKRKDNKQSKGSNEKTTNNRKGLDCLSSFPLTLSTVCRLFFEPFALFVVVSFDHFDCLSSFLLTLLIVCRLFF